jgi:tRNA-dihydrouridine synthase
MLILAPMQGLTELMFRKVYHRCFPGALDYAISPFLSLTHGNLTEAWEKIDDVLPEPNRNSIPVIPQILGKEPVEFIDLANRLFDIGYTEINWNIGCPMRRVTAKHRGSGILPYPDEVDRILGQVIPHLKPRLSVKMRLGLKSPDEIFNLIPVLNNYPLLNVTIHPRTGRQQYTGQVDLDTFSRALPLLHHKVIYNGDICTPADYRRISQRFPSIQEFMIGRGILYDPLLPLKIKKGQPDNPAATLHFVQELLNAIQELPIREESRMRKTKEYWCLIRRSLPITEQQAMTVLHAQSPQETTDRIQSLFLTL